MQDDRVQINFRIKPSLLERIKIETQGINVSDFIRTAVENELAHSHDSGQEYREMTKKINKIDAESLHKTLGDLVIKTQVIFEELRKQNELLKLIHRRSTFSSMFSKNILDEVKKSEELSKAVQLKAMELIQDELKQLKF
jgi:hypothetical protein